MLNTIDRIESAPTIKTIPTEALANIFQLNTQIKRIVKYEIDKIKKTRKFTFSEEMEQMKTV
jgi:hypothetical protein